MVVPEYIVVHDGSPRDSTATDYYVKYKDYIKNVASSEIYATWPANTIRANVLAIMSFALEQSLSGVVQEPWIRLYDYLFHCIRSEVDPGEEYIRIHLRYRG